MQEFSWASVTKKHVEQSVLDENSRRQHQATVIVVQEEERIIVSHKGMSQQEKKLRNERENGAKQKKQLLESASYKDSKVPVNSSKAKGQRVCQFFLKGHCKKGNDCNMKHDGAPHPNEIVEDVVQNHEDEDVRRALWQRWLAESRTYSYTIPSKTRNGEPEEKSLPGSKSSKLSLDERMGASVYKYALVIQALRQLRIFTLATRSPSITELPKDIRVLILGFLFELATAPQLHAMFNNEPLRLCCSVEFNAKLVFDYASTFTPHHLRHLDGRRFTIHANPEMHQQISDILNDPDGDLYQCRIYSVMVYDHTVLVGGGENYGLVDDDHMTYDGSAASFNG